MSANVKNNLRVWGVWDRVISRLEYLSESQSSCRHFMDLLEKSGRTGFEILRFDLSPLYYDLPRTVVNAPTVRGFSLSPAPRYQDSVGRGSSAILKRKGR